jgi:hypothetical protein
MTPVLSDPALRGTTSTWRSKYVLPWYSTVRTHAPAPTSSGGEPPVCSVVMGASPPTLAVGEAASPSPQPPAKTARRARRTTGMNQGLFMSPSTLRVPSGYLT